MNSWKGKLQDLVTKKQGPGKEGSRHESKEERRRRLDAFFNEVVLPAFRELEQELRASHPDVVARIDREPYQITLSVYRNDSREFYYTVREVRLHRGMFAFPQIVSPGEHKEWRVQVVMPGKECKPRDPGTFTKEGLIEDFLDRYAKCPGL